MQPFFWGGTLVRPIVAALAVALVTPLFAPLVARADGGDDNVEAGAAVARLSIVEGNVAIARGDSNTTVAAVVNAPVLGADYVTTGPQSRAEVQFDGRAVVRLGENVQMRFSHIDTDHRELQLAAGTVDFRLFRAPNARAAIDTPSVSLVPRAAGSYRVSVDSEGTTVLTVRSGQADLETPAGAQRLDAGTSVVADGSAADPHVTVRDAVAQDAFDAFNARLDRTALDALADQPYVNSDIQGAADLGAYGRWVDDGSYGHVWIPNNVNAGWAPYRIGHWVWEDGYGWTWVAAEPWGWAPYHYGRWYYSAAYSHWCWYPPVRTAFVPAWSPALVGFVGLTIGAVGIGLGFGHIGWVPLAPYEAFHPWWGRRGTTIVNNVTVNNITVNNYNGFRNARFNGATSVSVENFRAGRFEGAREVTHEQFAGARPVAVRGALPIVPTANNLRFGATGTVAPAAFRTETFAGRGFAGGQAPTVTRVPFSEQQATVSRMTHVPIVPSERAPLERTPVQHAVIPADARPVVPAYTRPEPQSERIAPAAAVTSSDPWARYNGARATQPVSRSQERPSQPEQRAGATQFQAPATGQPGYVRPAVAPAYQRPRTSPIEQGSQTSPIYPRQRTLPADQRPPASPAYQRSQVQPAYQRPQAAPAYQRIDPGTSQRRASTPATQQGPAREREPQGRESRGERR